MAITNPTTTPTPIQEHAHPCPECSHPMTPAPMQGVAVLDIGPGPALTIRMEHTAMYCQSCGSKCLGEHSVEQPKGRDS